MTFSSQTPSAHPLQFTCTRWALKEGWGPKGRATPGEAWGLRVDPLRAPGGGPGPHRASGWEKSRCGPEPSRQLGEHTPPSQTARTPLPEQGAHLNWSRDSRLTDGKRGPATAGQVCVGVRGSRRRGWPGRAHAYLRQQQDALLQPPGQGLVRLPLLPLLQQLGADLAHLLLQLLPHLVQLPGAAQRGGRAEREARPAAPRRSEGPTGPGGADARAQNRAARAASR